MALRIFSYLNASALLSAALVSRRWYCLANDKVRTCCSQGFLRWGSDWTEPSALPFLLHHQHTQSIWRRMCLNRGWAQTGLEAAARTAEVNVWKVRYAEAITLQTNWRRGRYDTRLFEGHQGMVHALHLGGLHLLTAGHDGTVRVKQGRVQGPSGWHPKPQRLLPLETIY